MNSKPSNPTNYITMDNIGLHRRPMDIVFTNLSLTIETPSSSPSPSTSLSASSTASVSLSSTTGTTTSTTDSIVNTDSRRSSGLISSTSLAIKNRAPLEKLCLFNNIKPCGTRTVTTTATQNAPIESNSVNKRRILTDISGYARSGQILAILGPSGSGKTTLLHILSGRMKPDSGCVWINGEVTNRQLQRRIAYVLQQDIFFPDLSLRQTLIYTALLRLPEWLSYEQKIRHVEKVIDLLDLRKCQHTIIGNILKRGLSGGEKKRASIACELLSNPGIMLLDEPTSGLDSTTALNIMRTLKDYAIREKKTIITTVHQPSSQIYHLFDKLMFISRGSLAYFGDLHDFVPFLNRLGYTIDPHFNPADYMMDKLKNSEDDELKIINSAKSLIRFNKRAIAGCNEDHHHAHLQCASCQIEDDEDMEMGVKDSALRDLRDETNPLWTGSEDSSHPHHPHHNLHHAHNHTAHSIHHHHQHSSSGQHHPEDPNVIKSLELRVMIDPCGKTDYDSGHSSFIETDRSSSSSFSSSSFASTDEMYYNCHSFSVPSSSVSESSCTSGDDKESKWPTSFWTQFRILVQRNFFEAKGRLLFKLNWIQTIGLGLISGLMWFQVARTESSIDDIRGWMFFATSYWMLFALFGALISLPLERDIVNKERSSGIYRLSSYYLAKLVGEIPLTITLPTVFFFISYPLFSIHSVQVLVMQWAFLVLNTIVAQTIGFVIAITSNDIEMSVTIAALYSTATNLFAGFYSNTIPCWLSFLKYTSIVYYAFQNMQTIEFTYGPPITYVECDK